MHISQQILHVLRTQYLAVTRHILAAATNDFSDAIVIRWKAGLREILMLKDALQARPFFPFGRIRTVAAIAIIVVNLAPCSLLRVQSEFGIRFSTDQVAGIKSVKDFLSALGPLDS